MHFNCNNCHTIIHKLAPFHLQSSISYYFPLPPHSILMLKPHKTFCDSLNTSPFIPPSLCILYSLSQMSFPFYHYSELLFTLKFHIPQVYTPMLLSRRMNLSHFSLCFYRIYTYTHMHTCRHTHTHIERRYHIILYIFIIICFICLLFVINSLRQRSL